MTKKDFKELTDVHVYGRGKNKVNAIYVEWADTVEGRGFKYAVASTIENCTRAELMDIAYDWIVNQKYTPFYVYTRFAQYDKQRFKVPLSFNPQNWN